MHPKTHGKKVCSCKNGHFGESVNIHDRPVIFCKYFLLKIINKHTLKTRVFPEINPVKKSQKRLDETSLELRRLRQWFCIVPRGCIVSHLFDPTTGTRQVDTPTNRHVRMRLNLPALVNPHQRLMKKWQNTRDRTGTPLYAWRNRCNTKLPSS